MMIIVGVQDVVDFGVGFLNEVDYVVGQNCVVLQVLQDQIWCFVECQEVFYVVCLQIVQKFLVEIGGDEFFFEGCCVFLFLFGDVFRVGLVFE